MEQTIISYRCPHCQRPLAKSDNPEYVYQCVNCDEDFYGFEARMVTVRLSELTPEDIKPFTDLGFNIDFSERVKVTVTAATGETGFCYMERERAERLGAQYVADHAMLLETSIPGIYDVEVSQNDYWNDLTRNPEEIIPVEFVEIERGTGREVYKGKYTGIKYYREVFYPRENCAKWYIQTLIEHDGNPVRPNLIFDHNGQREKVRYDDWNGVMAYPDTFNKDF